MPKIWPDPTLGPIAFTAVALVTPGRALACGTVWSESFNSSRRRDARDRAARNSSIPFPPRAARLNQLGQTVRCGQIPGFTAHGAVDTLGGNGFAQRGPALPSNATATGWFAAIDRTVSQARRQDLTTSWRSKRSGSPVPRRGLPACTTTRARRCLSDPQLRTPCPDVRPELGPCGSVGPEGMSARA